MRPSAIFLPVCLVAACMAAGCQVNAPASMVSIDTLVSEYNANADQVDRLWARAEVTVSLPGQLLPFQVSGILVLRKTDDPLGPHDFVLTGYENLATELFRLGSSAAESKYYFWYGFGDSAQAWWGRHELAGAPGVEEMPIDPNQLLGVLGVCVLPSDLSAIPTVAVSMTHRPGEPVAAGDRPAYVLTYIDRQAVSRRILFTRELMLNWDDSDVRTPFAVRLLDDAGRRVVVAQLSDYRPVETARPGRGPLMPTDIRISWPERGSSVHITLSGMTTADKWDIEACRFEENLPAAIAEDDIVQVDRHVQGEGI